MNFILQAIAAIIFTYQSYTMAYEECQAEICQKCPQPIAKVADNDTAMMYEIFDTPMTYSDAQDLCSCKQNGALAQINSSNIAALASKSKQALWIDSWNTDNYGNVCLQMINTSVTAVDCCLLKGVICEYKK